MPSVNLQHIGLKRFTESKRPVRVHTPGIFTSRVSDQETTLASARSDLRQRTDERFVHAGRPCRIEDRLPGVC